MAWDAVNVACKPLSRTKAGSPIGSGREVGAGEWGRSLFNGIISSKHFKLLDTEQGYPQAGRIQELGGGRFTFIPGVSETLWKSWILLPQGGGGLSHNMPVWTWSLEQYDFIK